MMRVGLDSYTIGHLRLSALETLDFAEREGLGGVQFTLPTEISPQLRSGELEEVRRRAGDLQLYLEVGISSINPLREPETAGRSPAEHAAALRPQLEAAASLGCRAVRCYVGWHKDRFSADHGWPAQLRAAKQVAIELRPVLRDLDLHLAVETHADSTSAELLEFVESIGPDVVGICLDTGNLTMVLEDPLLAAERLAPYVWMTHLKDSILFFADRGFAWQARPAGGGIVPLDEILHAVARYKSDLTLSIEDHPRIYELPIFDADWLAHFPQLQASELARVVRIAHHCSQEIAQSRLVDPQTEEAVPWEARYLDRLRLSAAYLQDLAEAIARAE